MYIDVYIRQKPVTSRVHSSWHIYKTVCYHELFHLKDHWPKLWTWTKGRGGVNASRVTLSWLGYSVQNSIDTIKPIQHTKLLNIKTATHHKIENSGFKPRTQPYLFSFDCYEHQSKSLNLCTSAEVLFFAETSIYSKFYPYSITTRSDIPVKSRTLILPVLKHGPTPTSASTDSWCVQDAKLTFQSCDRDVCSYLLWTKGVGTDTHGLTKFLTCSLVPSLTHLPARVNYY